MNRTLQRALLSLGGGILLIAVITGAGFAWLLYSYATMKPNVQTTSHALTYEGAKATYPLLPSTASNIWSAHASVGMGGRAHLYRFDAPSPDCLAYAAQLIHRSNYNSDSNHQVSTELLILSDPPSPVQAHMMEAYGFETLDWFDVETVRSGFTGRGPPLGLSSFWIDTDRNRFYYYWTD